MLETILLYIGLPLGGLAAASGAFMLLTPWGPAALALFASSRAARMGLGLFGAALAVGLACLKAFRAGKAGARADVERANATAQAERAAIDVGAAQATEADLRAELGRWSAAKVLPILLLAGFLAGCQTTGGRGGAFCDVERPTRLSASVIAAMNHDELAAAVAHNRFGAAQCGWTP